MARIAFLGTGDIALPVFRWLLDSSYQNVLLVTQPDRPAGRRRELRSPALKFLAVEAGVPVLQPERVRDAQALEAIRELAPDVIVVMAYGQILPRELIAIPRIACVNLHASLLPRYRGAACIQAAIDAGDAETGITLMHVVKELDAGDVILSHSLGIGRRETAGALHDRLADLAVPVLAEGLPQLLDGTAPRIPQAELGEATYVPKLERDEGRLDWSRSAGGLERRLRAYDPWPGCWTTWEGRRMKLFPVAEAGKGFLAAGRVAEDDGQVRVGCGEGSSLVLADVQPDGARRMPAHEWWRGLQPERRGNLEFI
jgi:methionyl-tRNA formyltransferase